MARRARRIVIAAELCKGCHICISACSFGVLKKADQVDNRGFYLPEVDDLDACRVCRLCEMECPDFAITVIED